MCIIYVTHKINKNCLSLRKLYISRKIYLRLYCAYDIEEIEIKKILFFKFRKFRSKKVKKNVC